MRLPLIHALNALFAATLLLATVARASDYAPVVVQAPSGVEAWLVEDHSLPLIAIRFRFEGGAMHDPEGQTGLTYLLSGLMDEGAGDLNAADFQTALLQAGAEMSFHAYSDRLVGSARLLADEPDAAFALIGQAISLPRFDPDRVRAIQGYIENAVIAEQQKPNAVAVAKLRRVLYADHPYARSVKGTPESVKRLDRDTLVSLHRQTFTKQNLTIAVVGAITPEELARQLDVMFAALPKGQSFPSRAETPGPHKGGDAVLELNAPATEIRMVFPSVPTSDPDRAALEVAQHILSGGFTSRLFHRLRRDMGAVYRFQSRFHDRAQAQEIVFFTSVSSETVDPVLVAVDDEIARFIEKGVTQAELEAAKRYVAGAYVSEKFKGSLEAADTLVNLKAAGHGPDFLRLRQTAIEAVTAADVQRVSRAYFGAKPARMFLGRAPSHEDAALSPLLKEVQSAHAR